jgi:hypothetical protein
MKYLTKVVSHFKYTGMSLFRFFYILSIFVICNDQSNAQNYHATNGSAFAGSVGIFNNPASGINSVYKWDLNIFSFQTTFTTNNIFLSKNTTVSNSITGNTKVNFKEGSNSYYAHQNLDFNLFNFTYKIDQKHAFGIGLRGRMYNHLKTSPMFANDTLTTGYSFFRANRTTSFLEGFITHQGWIELNLNYSQVLHESDRTRLTGGITLNIAKALSGFQGKVNRINFEEFIVPANSDTGYIITQGGIQYAYTNNYDLPNTGTQNTLNQIIKNSLTNLGLNLGLEYSIYNAANTDAIPHTPTNYSWKFGFSLMDLGKNTFNPSIYAGSFYNPAPRLTDAVLDSKTSNTTSILDVKDSLKTMFLSYDSLVGKIEISRPTRIILNADKNLGNHFSINGQLNINFYSTGSYKRILTRELNLLTITPRWETIVWGFYLPLQYTTQGRFWVGAAVKLGPLTIGVHNIALKKAINELNGGGYLMLSVHPFNKRKIMSRFDCPDY